MNKIVSVLVCVFLFSASAYAGPYLVCDPQDGVDLYDIYGNGALIVADHPAEADGSLKYEFAAPMPDTTFEAVAKNVWGPSEKSDPYLSPSLAGKPQNLKLAP